MGGLLSAVTVVHVMQIITLIVVALLSLLKVLKWVGRCIKAKRGGAGFPTAIQQAGELDLESQLGQLVGELPLADIVYE